MARAGQPSGEKVIAAVRHAFGSVNDYRVDVTLSVKSSKISINNMGMAIYYKKPNKVHVDPKGGIAIIPQGTYFGNPIEQLAVNGRAVYLRSECRQGRDCHVVQVVSTGAPTVTVWVDKERNIILATETSGQFTARSAWSYTKIDGKYYLPALISADMTVPGGPNGPEKAKVDVRFSNYTVNKGISDKIFEQKASATPGHRR